MGRISKTTTLTAAVARKRGGPLRFEKLELEPPKKDEILVRIAASGICHTDIGLLDDWTKSDGPVVFGHEGAGVVERCGAGVKGIAPGDHVVISYQSCGACAACKKKRPYDCKELWPLNFGFRRLDGTNALSGGVRGHFFGQSSFATYALATKRNVVKVPREKPLPLLAPLGCGIQTGAGTVLNTLKAKRGSSIIVFGTGAVGLAAIMVARIAGASKIVGVDIVKSRLKLAAELGATHVFQSNKKTFPAKIRALLDGGADYAIDTTGRDDIIEAAADLLKPRGVIALIASPDNAGPLSQGKKVVPVIQGSAIPQRFIPRLIKLFDAGRLPIDRLVKFYDFRDINKAISDAKKGTVIKPVLVFKGVSR